MLVFLSMDRIRVKYECTQFEKELNHPLGELSLCLTFTTQLQLLSGRQTIHMTPPPSWGLYFSREQDICMEFMLTNIPQTFTDVFPWLVSSSGFFFPFLLLLSFVFYFLFYLQFPNNSKYLWSTLHELGTLLRFLKPFVDFCLVSIRVKDNDCI